MYRYSTNRARGNTGAPGLKERAKTLLIIVLLAALVVGLIVGVPAVKFKNDARQLYLARIQLECGNALDLSGSLSRTAGTSSTSTLSKIRSYVYAMETINSLSVGMDGSNGYIISEDWFTNLYSIIDAYTSQLLTGMNTSEQQTSLYNSLQTLSQQLSGVD